MECDSTLLSGYDFFASYWDRLKEAGCKRLLYMFSGERLPLGQKWKEMAKQASGAIFLLQASDEYCHDRRVDVAGSHMAAWYDTRYYHSYSFISKKLLFFDKESSKQWLTGNDMAIQTQILRNIPDNDHKQGVDFFLYSNLNGALKIRDQHIYPGLHTNGANTISTARERFYEKPEIPWQHTDLTVDDLGLPVEVVDRIKAFAPESYIENMKRTSVNVKFIANIPGTCMGQERNISADAYLKLRDKCILLDQVKPNYVKQLI